MNGIITVVGIILFTLILILSLLALIYEFVKAVREWGWVSTIWSLIFLLGFILAMALSLYIAITYL